MNLEKAMDFIERGGRVQRMHTVPTLQAQNVAAHSFGVAWLCYLLHPTNEPSTNLLLAALQHDLAEHVTGDIPAPTKRRLDIRQSVAEMEVGIVRRAGFVDFEVSLDEKDSGILKLADTAELCMHCLREMTLGNRSPQLKEMFQNAIAYCRESGEQSNEIVNILIEQYKEVWK